MYHPFRNTLGDDDILQVPLAVILPNTDLIPQPLLKLIANTKLNQYALFPKMQQVKCQDI